MSVPQKIVRNATFNILGYIWIFSSNLLLVPYLLSKLGLALFGLWSLVSVFISYLGLSDLGIGSTLVKYVSEYYAQKKPERINEVVNTAIVFFSVILGLVSLFGFIALDSIITLLRIPPELHALASFGFSSAIVLFTLNSVLGVFTSVLNGFQRMDIVNRILIIGSILNIAATVTLLESGYGFTGLVYANIFSTFLVISLNVLFANRVFPLLKIDLKLFNRDCLKQLTGFSTKLYVSTVADFLHLQIDKLFLTFFMNLSFVSFYQIAARVISAIRMVPLLLISPLLPAASELDANNDKKALTKLYFLSLKYVSLVTFPLFMLALIFAQELITLWVGPTYPLSAITLQILLAGYLVNILSGPGFSILNGIGKPEYGLRSSLFAIALNVVLSAFLILKLGFIGAAIGTSLSMLFAASYFIILFHKVTNTPFKPLSKIIFVPFFASLTAGGAIFLVKLTLGGVLPILFSAVIGGIVFSLLYPFIIINLNFLDEDDFQTIKLYVPIGTLFLGLIKKFKIF